MENTKETKSVKKDTKAHSLNVKDKKERKSFGTCMICLENLYKDEHRMFLPCSHHFHDACIRPWLENKTVCPNCKISVYVKVDEKEPEKIPEHFKNPTDSRTLSEVLRERQEQTDILDQIHSRAPREGLGNLMDRLMGSMEENQSDNSLSLIMDFLMREAVGEGHGFAFIAEGDSNINPVPNIINALSELSNGDGGDSNDDLPPLEYHDPAPDGEDSDDDLPPLGYHDPAPGGAGGIKQ